MSENLEPASSAPQIERETQSIHQDPADDSPLQPGQVGYADKMLEEVYEDQMVNGPGDGMDGKWYKLWAQLVAEPAQVFDVVGGKVGERSQRSERHVGDHPILRSRA